MKTKRESTMTWEEAPNAISPMHLSKILGIGTQAARDVFKNKNFPIIPGTEAEPLAEKEAVRLYLQGIQLKNQPKESLLYLILLELKELNKKEVDTND